MGSGSKLDWWFSDQCARARILEDLADLLEVEFQRLGFRYFALVSHVNPAAPPKGAVMLHNYPKPWIIRFASSKYWRRDAVYLFARETAQPFLWTDPKFLKSIDPDQRLILEEAAQHGLKYGVTIPLHGPNRFSASCSLVSEYDDIDFDRVQRAGALAACAYEAGRRIQGPMEDLRPMIKLARRERQCLVWVARGKDDEAIAIILGISSETVNGYIEGAKRKLNAVKRTQAVAYAIYTGAINLEDIFGA
ncbi:autoinducer binding domain-containing protein [Terricaulis silvestris]|uniref:Regulatory protein SdiA n=1 Tax=Terricaulis silvestris TaxID=2686094 RepID=A0A6I6MNL6_9CAUL|nr:autoinducer binding domain-containing protein [Terricaulis silvestris]QGZ94948.1 Regulatory protein SdiA [Terricaulis silvestris]